MTGLAVTDLDFNKEMAIFGHSDREIHKIFYFPIARYDFWVLGITEQSKILPGPSSGAHKLA
jgi:hypothetical protein